ncbi:MAG TPA: hypothetical protein IGS17_01445 [Oscillatoriales cyanobacterium M59_W2019_021]|nr:hypothetical protein [Oscillatoriales cyanobacterium M4454_W2019_049]HIK49579.1 hypothetical protein [Oscillatoriales cyanobacterium M59_W2019_021]
MNRFAPSSIQAINAAMQKDNPFEGHSTVSEREIWGRACPDLLELNIHASTVIWQAIKQVGSPLHSVRAIAFLAEPGMGKSHLLSRIRHQLQARGNGLFIYINAQQFTDTSLIRQQFLYAIVNSLKYTGSQGIMQWQELALFPLEQALSISRSDSLRLDPKRLIEKLNEQSLAKNQAWINQVTDILFKAQPDIENPDLLRAIIWMLCNSQAPYARHWIAGRSIAQWKLDEVGLSDRTGENREALAWEMTVQLLQTICQYLPVVIAFDRLESDDINEAVVKKEQVVASLIKRLSDNLCQMQYPYGVVLVSTMTPMTWYEKIIPFLGKFSNYVSGPNEPISLSSIDSHTLREVLAQWLVDFYLENHLIPSNPLYPFEYYQIQALIRENLTLKDAIDWFADNFKPIEVDPIEKVERVFQQLLERNWFLSLHSDFEIANALSFSFQTLVGQTIAQFKIERVTDEIEPKQENQNYIQFKIVGIQKERRSSIGIAVSQSRNGRTVGAVLKRLLRGDVFGLTRTCLIRSKTLKISPTWKAYPEFETWQNRERGLWVDVNLKEMIPLLVLCEMYERCELYQLTEAQILEFIDRTQILDNHPTLEAIVQPPPDDTPETASEMDNTYSQSSQTPTPSTLTDPLCDDPPYSFQQDEL